ncbi:hypothetical protein NL676_019499 [Syzygium grande]|nr:hypothetical protein NL676_019499 [Syzygium grande]
MKHVCKRHIYATNNLHISSFTAAIDNLGKRHCSSPSSPGLAGPQFTGAHPSPPRPPTPRHDPGKPLRDCAQPSESSPAVSAETPNFRFQFSKLQEGIFIGHYLRSVNPEAL